MAKIDLISKEWCELVFEGRNKSYGAYDLRAKSGLRNRRAFIFLLAFLALIAAVIGVKTAVQALTSGGEDLDSSTLMELQNLKDDKVEEDKPKDVPKEEPKPMEEKVAVKASIQFTVPEIVDVVDEKKKMKDQEELVETKIAIASVTYEGDEGGKGTIDDLKENQSAGGTVAQEAKEEVEDKKVHDVVEVMPTFPGGESALLNYVSTHLKYPAIAQEEDIQGVVNLKFVVLENGAVGDVKIVKSLHPACDKAAIAVVKSLPRFIPGKQQGRAVKVWFNLPIRFTIM